MPIELEEEIPEPPVEIKEAVSVTAKAPERDIIEKLVKRSFETSNVIDVDADSLKVTLYDNGEVDNDTISLFYNRKLVTFKKMLSSKPLTFTLPLDTTVNEISMYAENLGSIPPNTALCIVYAGNQRFEMSLSSTYIKNAAIRFRKKPKL
jgi:archaellum component FlaF (FlaF/FlaG flagellin family)